MRVHPRIADSHRKGEGMTEQFALNRRSFLKGAGVAGALGAAAVLGVGCTQPSKADESLAETGNAEAPLSPAESTPAAFSEPTDGKFVTKTIGHEGYVYVETTMAGGKIANCQVINHDETIGIGSLACTMFPAKIVENQSVKVDAVSGATTTCMTIAQAVMEGIENSGHAVSDFQAEIAAPSGGTAQTAEVDVAIMGAGTAGLIAATRLLEKGKTVLVIEKQDIPGGSMSMTYSGVAAAESELQKNYSLGRFDDTPFINLEAMMELLGTMVDPQFDRFNGAMPYDRALYETSGKLVDWMNSIGVGFYTMGANAAYGATPYMAPGCYEGGCGYAMQFFVDRIGALGGQIVYGTTVTELTADGNGAITGLKAEGKDGSTWDVTAKAVLLASGGFAANPDMVAEYYPDYASFSFNCCPASTGDGIVLGQKAGAAIECMGRTLGSYLSTTAQAGSRMEIAFIHQTSPGIMVNAHGDQFDNIISGNHGAMTRGLLNPDNGGKFFYITDESGAIGAMNSLTWGFDTYKSLFDRGDMVHYGSVEEAAEALGLPNLAQTIEKHNAHALAGEEDEFGRKNLPFLDFHDGIWVCASEPTPYLTTGGLAIDTACHVLTESGEPIANLYAAGDVCGSVEEKDGKNYGMGFDAAMNYGYIAAETITAAIA